jgi:hypothetical protein
MFVGTAADWMLHIGPVAARADVAESNAARTTAPASESTAKRKRVKRETVCLLI